MTQSGELKCMNENDAEEKLKEKIYLTFKKPFSKTYRNTLLLYLQ
jgi:hypothetical protein